MGIVNVLFTEKKGPRAVNLWYSELLLCRNHDCKLLCTLVLICFAVITNKELRSATYTHVEIPVLLDVVDVCLKKKKQGDLYSY